MNQNKSEKYFFEKQNLNGWLNFDKPKNFSSSDCVNKIKSILKAKKVGHAGTLDPMATGVLPIALGEATKAIRFIMESEKTYSFKARWGIETTTDDIEGDAVRTTNNRPTEQSILENLNTFRGEIIQTPPNYSAIKINGKRAYKISRLGSIPNLKARKVKIIEFKLMQIINKDEAEFFVRCEKGTYIRSLTRDLGRKLGVLGHVSSLNRESVGIFFKKQSISLDKIKKITHNSAENSLILPILYPIDDCDTVEVNLETAKNLLKGKKIPVEKVRKMKVFDKIKNGILFLTTVKKIPIAICVIEDCLLKPKRVFNTKDLEMFDVYNKK